MQVGICQLVMPAAMPIDEFFAQASAAGYETVELALRQEGALTPRTTDAELRRIVSLASTHRLGITSVTMTHCTGNLLAAGAARETSLAQTRRGMEIAKALGASHVLHTLGRFTPDLYYDDAYRHGVESLKHLVPTCEKLGVKIAIEFIWTGFLFSPLEMRRFLDEVGSPDVGFYFDPGNMAVFQFPHHWVRIVGDKTFLVHLKDWKGKPHSGCGWPALLEGEVDYAAVMRQLRAIGYDGPLTSEVPPGVARLEKTAAAIRRIMAM